MKKKFLVLLAIFSLFFCFTAVPARADSGWDFDYDSGGSSDWGSSWDSGGWDSSYDDWDSGSSSYGSTSFDSSFSLVSFIIFIVGMIIFIEIFYTLIKNMKKMQGIDKNDSIYKELTLEQLKLIDPNIDIQKTKEEVFEIYKKIQIAWMDFDYDTIRNNTTDELYNMYSSQLDTLKMKKQKNIMDDITLKEIRLYDIKRQEDTITLKVYLVVSVYDYVIKEESKEVVRGEKKRKMKVKYELTFAKSAINDKDSEKCPNCGAPVDIKASATCPYCDSILVKEASSYVLSKKTCVGQEYDD